MTGITMPIGGSAVDQDKAIITVYLIKQGISKDLEVPLDISANELCEALFHQYYPEHEGDVEQFFLRSERPIALLRGEKTLREYGIRDGSVINITR